MSQTCCSKSGRNSQTTKWNTLMITLVWTRVTAVSYVIDLYWYITNLWALHSAHHNLVFCLSNIETDVIPFEVNSPRSGLYNVIYVFLCRWCNFASQTIHSNNTSNMHFSTCHMCVLFLCSSKAWESELGVSCRGGPWWPQGLHCPSRSRPHGCRSDTAGAGWSQCKYSTF